jgi:deoxyribose-phosphate aldolase
MGTAVPAAGGIQLSAAELHNILITPLKPDALQGAIDKVCEEAIQYKFKSVCVNSTWVPYVAKKLQRTGVLVCSVVGFPLGAMESRAKAFETRQRLNRVRGKLTWSSIRCVKIRDLKTWKKTFAPCGGPRAAQLF